MKQIIKISLLMIVALTVLAACQNNGITDPLPTDQEQNPQNSNSSMYSVAGNQSLSIPIWNERNAEIGYIQLANNASNLFVTFIMHEGWELLESSLFIGNTFADLPRDSQGAPLPEQFGYQVSHGKGTKIYSQKFPLTSIGAGIGDDIVIASQARVISYDINGKNSGEEIVWGGDTRGNGPLWWWFSQYRLRLNLDGYENIGRIKTADQTNQVIID